MGLSKKKGQQQTLPDEKSRLTGLVLSNRSNLKQYVDLASHA